MKGLFGMGSTPNTKLVQARTEYCKEQALGKQDVANSVKVNLDTYCRWERGKQKPGLRHLRLLCKLFQKTPEELGYTLDDIGN